MATIGPVTSAIEPQGVSATVDVGYRLNFDDFDQNSNQPYVEACRLVGVDTLAADPTDTAPDETSGC